MGFQPLVTLDEISTASILLEFMSHFGLATMNDKVRYLLFGRGTLMHTY